MTLFEPTLILTRLVISRGSTAVYDEAFHEGVNVIRGENSSGKSTVLNAIFYGLGGDLSDWSEVALLCTHVTLEVQLNEKIATLRREISPQPGQPMMIFGGAYGLALNAPIDEWKRYPYRRSASLESFSQTLFRLLGFPEAASDEGGNITMHQVLRLLYADQLSPVESLFRFERFDPPALREAIGRLLCGSYDPSIYQHELEIRTISRDYDAVSGELRSLFSVLGRADQEVGFKWITERTALLENERHLLALRIEATEQRLFELGDSDQITLQVQQDAYSNVRRLQQDLQSAEQDRDRISFTMADSASFISSLERKLEALSDAERVAEHVGGVRFGSCPACYAPIEEDDSLAAHACHLCKTPFDSEFSRSRIVALINDAATQLKQSVQLQKRRSDDLANAKESVARYRREWDIASRVLSERQRLPSTGTQEELRELNRRAGYLDREIENLASQQKVVALIQELTDRKEALNAQISRLREAIDTTRSMQVTRFSRAYEQIENQVIDLLRNDLRRQDSFENPTSVDFDFGANRISVDGHTYFSASSRVILKSSFFLGFLAAATQDQNFRHPRFAIIDTIEDKGMEPERSHNFQNQILRKSRESKSSHQIIFATAMISPELDEEEYTIGRFSTRDEPALRIAL